MITVVAFEVELDKQLQFAAWIKNYSTFYRLHTNMRLDYH